MKQTSKKRTIATAAIALSCVLLSGVPANAAPVDSGTTEATVSFTAGSLKLDSVPVLDFGSHPMSNLEEQYPAENALTPIQVGDLRGSGKGWDLMVSLTSFTGADGEKSLQAAGIQVTNPDVEAVNGSVGAPPVAELDVTIPSDGTETLVWKAAQDQGMGVWALVWKAAETKLLVKPGTAKEGTNTATLNWSLQSTP